MKEKQQAAFSDDSLLPREYFLIVGFNCSTQSISRDENFSFR